MLREKFDLDSLVLAEGGRWGRLRIAHTPNVSDEWLTAQIATPALVRKLHSDGCTVVINDLQERIHCVFRLCQELGALFVAGVNCNAYWTRASNHGLAKHYDDEDVIVVQVEGSKQWRLFPQNQGIDPVPGMPYCQEHVDSHREVAEMRLTPGQALYIPRGVAHEAYCTDEPSLHFTFSLQSCSRLELIEEALRQAAMAKPDPLDLRKRIDLADMLRCNASTTEVVATQSTLRRLADELDAALMGKVLMSLAQKRCLAMASPLLAGSRTCTDVLNEESTLHPTPMQLVVYCQTSCQLHFKGGSIDIDDSGKEVARRLSARLPIQVRDLPGASHGQRVALANELVDAGLVAPCVPTTGNSNA